MHKHKTKSREKKDSYLKKEEKLSKKEHLFAELKDNKSKAVCNFWVLLFLTKRLDFASKRRLTS